MKKISILSLIFFVFGITVFAQNNQTVMTINGKPVLKSDFEYIYNKNNSNNVIDKKSLNEYVDMFVDFKLKVEEAVSLGIDTTKAFKTEFNSYRDQLASQYLNVNKVNADLVKKTYDRMKTELEVSHIMVEIPMAGTAADTLKAYNQAMEIYKRALKEDFGKLAAEVSAEPSAKTSKGYVGWISALRVPPQFEVAAYNTPVGKVSKPVRTVFGYHIIKVTNKQTSPGQIKVAHILLLDDPQNPSVKDKNKVRIDSIYQRLKAGDDFSEMASKLSQDFGSAQQKGELPWFGTGQTLPEFEKQAFALTDSGSISQPVHSRAGWHIIKLIGKKPMASFEEMKSDLEKQLIRLSSEGYYGGNQFIKDLKKEYNYTENKDALKEYIMLLERIAPNDSLFAQEVKMLASKDLFTIGGETYYQRNFNNYLIASAASYRGGVRSDFLKLTYDKYVEQEVINFERNRLTEKYPEYRNLVNEYHDGILLFEVMNRKVWERASKDDEGLSEYFEQNKERYNWEKPHYKGYVIYAKDKDTFNAAKRMVEYADFDSVGHYLPQRLNDSIQYVKVEKGLWEEGSNAVVDDEIFSGKKYKPSKDFPYYFVLGRKLKKPEVYADVKGKITVDYQDFLEKEWIKDLRTKYPVVINREVLQSVDKN